MAPICVGRYALSTMLSDEDVVMSDEERAGRTLVIRYHLLCYDSQWEEIPEFRRSLLKLEDVVMTIEAWNHRSSQFLRTSNIVPVGLQRIKHISVEEEYVEI